MQFSDQLVEKLIKHMREKYDHLITHDEAQEYLRSYADLYLAFAPHEHRLTLK